LVDTYFTFVKLFFRSKVIIALISQKNPHRSCFQAIVALILT